MKYVRAAFAASLLLISTALQASETVNLPQTVECQAERAVTVSPTTGIIDDPKLVHSVTHIFQRVSPSVYQFKNGYVSFNAKLTNQGSVLNLYAGSTTFSINLLDGRYVSSSAMDWSILARNGGGGTANGTFFQGLCKF